MLGIAGPGALEEHHVIECLAGLLLFFELDVGHDFGGLAVAQLFVQLFRIVRCPARCFDDGAHLANHRFRRFFAFGRFFGPGLFQGNLEDTRTAFGFVDQRIGIDRDFVVFGHVLDQLGQGIVHHGLERKGHPLANVFLKTAQFRFLFHQDHFIAGLGAFQGRGQTGQPAADGP